MKKYISKISVFATSEINSIFVNKKLSAIFIEIIKIADNYNIPFNYSVRSYKYNNTSFLSGSVYNKKYKISIDSKLYKKTLNLSLTYGEYNKDNIFKKEFQFNIKDKEKLILKIKDFINDEKFNNISPKSFYLNKIKKYGDLKDGWDFDNAKKISKLSIENALKSFEIISNVLNYYDIKIDIVGNEHYESYSTIILSLVDYSDIYSIKNLELNFNDSTIEVFKYESSVNSDGIIELDADTDYFKIEIKDILNEVFWLNPDLKINYRIKNINSIF